MSEKRTIGLTSIKVGSIASDGGMSTSLAILGVTEEGSATFTKEADEVKEFFCEESDDPIEIVSKKGKTIVEWSIVDFTPATLEKVLGGTVDVSVPLVPVWKAPDVSAQIEKSIEIVTKKGVKIEIPRALINASVDLSLGKDKLGAIKIKATVLTPTKAATPSVSIS